MISCQPFLPKLRLDVDPVLVAGLVLISAFIAVMPSSAKANELDYGKGYDVF